MLMGRFGSAVPGDLSIEDMDRIDHLDMTSEMDEVGEFDVIQKINRENIELDMLA